MSGRDLGHSRKVRRKTTGKGSWKINFKVIVDLQNQINTIDYPISKESSLCQLVPYSGFVRDIVVRLLLDRTQCLA